MRRSVRGFEFRVVAVSRSGPPLCLAAINGSHLNWFAGILAPMTQSKPSRTKVLSMSRLTVAQSSTLSVSVEIETFRDEFLCERKGNPVGTRSIASPFSEPIRDAVERVPTNVGLRLARAALYRRLPVCRSPGLSPRFMVPMHAQRERRLSMKLYRCAWLLL